MRRGLALLAVALAVTGCAAWPFGRGSARLAEADRLARSGDWGAAVAAYDDYLARYPDTAAAPRAQESRETAASMVAARAELARLRVEVARLRDELARRESDLTRVRQEADRLRADLERLKQIDLRLERKQ
ncbi:MAG TPA: hypothetical protein VFL90_03650 [Methylomirabilota bacterium]|nr:hypothetical protein [Methylomirabilota bacterium]